MHEFTTDHANRPRRINAPIKVGPARAARPEATHGEQQEDEMATETMQPWKWRVNVGTQDCSHCGRPTRAVFFTTKEPRRIPACGPMCAEAARRDAGKAN